MFYLRQSFVLASSAFVLVATAPTPIQNPGNVTGLRRRFEFQASEPVINNRKIDGKDVALTLITDLEDTRYFSTSSLVGGWKGKEDQPAVVRIWKALDEKSIETIETCVGFLKDPGVDLHYHSEKNKPEGSNDQGWEYVLVTKDMSKGYPKEGAPELYRLGEWIYGSTTNIGEATKKVRELAIKKAEEMAKKHKIVFKGMSHRNVWTNEKFDIVYFDTYDGAIRIQDDVDSEEGKKALKEMKENAEREYTEDSIKELLGKEQHTYLELV